MRVVDRQQFFPAVFDLPVNLVELLIIKQITVDTLLQIRQTVELRDIALRAGENAAAFAGEMIQGVHDDLVPNRTGHDQLLAVLSHRPPAIAGMMPISSPCLTCVAAPSSFRTFSPLTKTLTKRRISPSSSQTLSFSPG